MTSRLRYRPDMETEDGRGMCLEKYLSHNKTKLMNRRIFYVVRTNAEKNIFKVGIGGYGSNARHTAHHRLNQYVIQHGTHKNHHKNACVGVKVFYIYSTGQTKNVNKVHSRIYKLEQKIIKAMDARRRRPLPNRGKERFVSIWPKLRDVIHDIVGRTDIVDTITTNTHHTRSWTKRNHRPRRPQT